MNATLYENIIKNYWEYYRELEDDLLATRKYVAFDELNSGTFSMEYLKLFQAACSEIDVLGKAMASHVNPAFKPDDKQNNINKWWFEVQGAYRCYDSVLDAAEGIGGTPLPNCRRLCLGRFEVQPWKGFGTEWRMVTDRTGRTSNRCLLKSGCSTPRWWSDYNKVKHGRALDSGSGAHVPNYHKANLGNVIAAFAALHVLETSFMQSVGTADELQAFGDVSRLFERRERLTASDIGRICKA